MNCEHCYGSGFCHVGPTNEPKCIKPGCGNSLQNAIPAGSNDWRRCATCKTVWCPEKCRVCGGSGKKQELKDFDKLLAEVRNGYEKSGLKPCRGNYFKLSLGLEVVACCGLSAACLNEHPNAWSIRMVRNWAVRRGMNDQQIDDFIYGFDCPPNEERAEKRSDAFLAGRRAADMVFADT